MSFPVVTLRVKSRRNIHFLTYFVKSFDAYILYKQHFGSLHIRSVHFVRHRALRIYSGKIYTLISLKLLLIGRKKLGHGTGFQNLGQKVQIHGLGLFGITNK